MITLDNATAAPPLPAIPPAPYAFDGPYAGCLEFPEVAMDKRHIFIIYDILRSYQFRSALEIGCFNGASSTAFVEAVKSGDPKTGCLQSATFCDVSVSDSLVDVVRNCKYPEHVRITSQPSWTVLDSKEEFDFILVDAAHDIDSVSLEMKRLIRRKPLCLMAHDTNATFAGYSKCEGARMLKEVFAALPDYRCIEDCEARPGERTDRGLFFATRSAHLYDAAERIFARWR